MKQKKQNSLKNTAKDNKSAPKANAANAKANSRKEAGSDLDEE